MFLNVDLEVESSDALDDLLAALQPHVLDLGEPNPKPRYVLSLELGGDTAALGPDATIRGLVVLIRGLPPHARSLWDRATRRTFDIGIQAGSGPQLRELLEPETVGAVAEVGAGIAVTVYPAPE
jgi:hypothetical protein